MNSIGNNFTTDLLLLKPPFINPKPRFINPKFPNSITLTKPSNPRRITCCSTPNITNSSCSTASVTEVDMVKNSQGIWSAKRKRVVVLWDLDNKPPHGPPYQAAMALKKVALKFGDIVEISAYANRHAFIHLPHWVRQERSERRELDILERKGVSIPTDPYVCGVCGRKCRTNIDLKKHFKQLHERERQKKLSRMRSLKGKKRQKFKERFVSGNHKYEEAARSLIKPKVGYGLAAELRRAGVFVKEVEDKPQAADWAVKRQMQHSINSGIDWLFLVSDDSDFSEMLKRAQGSNLGTVVIGDSHRALGPHADFWVPWNGVENGEIGEEELMSWKSRLEFMERSDHESFSMRGFDEDSDDDDEDDDDYSDDDYDDVEEDRNLDQLVDELVITNTGFHGPRISAFSEGEDEEY
ncbi:hypothetical protein MKW98_015263 [Papaver atlanticum]|uniref:C2H2-type domain-containing protein n=1 Tax=Papaver atlanticum TaxID=357466 RepID=A0AAD4T372_9MAGN|nr:hypothetical protein MKW98_015263 [Papaver atlanticum]